MIVTIFGLGAIGSNLFVSLVKQFPEFGFVGVDFDVVEDRNIRTQAYFREHIGQPKAIALRAIGMRYVQKLKYIPLNMKVDDNFSSLTINDLTIGFKIDKDQLWIDCFDNAKSRSILKRIGTGLNLLHLGFSPLYSAEAIWNERYDVPGDVDPNQGDICSMEDAVGFIQTFCGLAVMQISDWIKTGDKKDFIITNKHGIIRL